MVEGKGDRIRELTELDRKIQGIDLEAGDWYRHQTAVIRDIRERLKTIIEREKEEPPQN